MWLYVLETTRGLYESHTIKPLNESMHKSTRVCLSGSEFQWFWTFRFEPRFLYISLAQDNSVVTLTSIMCSTFEKAPFRSCWLNLLQMCWEVVTTWAQRTFHQLRTYEHVWKRPHHLNVVVVSILERVSMLGQGVRLFSGNTPICWNLWSLQLFRSADDYLSNENAGSNWWLTKRSPGGRALGRPKVLVQHLTRVHRFAHLLAHDSGSA